MNKQELIESLRNEYIQGLITEDYYKGKNWGINIALGLVNQLDETKINKERTWLNEKVYGLSETISNVDGKGEYVGISKNAVLSLIDELERPEITEEPTFLEHLTRLFKKHGYDHLGQVALALENDLEISINKELPAIPQFVAEYLEDKSIYSFEERIAYLIKSSDGDSFYLHELLPESSCITEDEGERLYEYVQGKEPRDLLQLINGYTIEPPETLQVIVKNYGSTVYKTELPEDEAMKLIEGWRG